LSNDNLNVLNYFQDWFSIEFILESLNFYNLIINNLININITENLINFLIYVFEVVLGLVIILLASKAFSRGLTDAGKLGLLIEGGRRLANNANSDDEESRKREEEEKKK
jgi:hypothetical protein